MASRQVDRNKREIPQRLGAGVKRVHVAATNQRLGGKVGDHAINRNTGYTGETLYNKSAPTFDPVRYGNAVAATTQCGPGGSRRVMGSGSQGTYGDVGNKAEPAPRSGDVMSKR